MLPRDIELHGIQPVIQVANMAAAIASYRDTLGFEVDFVAGDPPVHARVPSGDRDRVGAVRIRRSPSAAARHDPG